MKPKEQNLHIDHNTIWRVTPKSNTAAGTQVRSISLFHTGKDNYEGNAFRKIGSSQFRQIIDQSFHLCHGRFLRVNLIRGAICI